MERKFRPLGLFVLGLLVLAPEIRAQYAVQIGIKQTGGRWKDTLLAGETSILTISITNPQPVAAYTLPFVIRSAANSAFARAGTESQVTYVGRMATPGNPFTVRSVNTIGVDGTSPDSILFGAVEFGSGYLAAGDGIVIEHPFTVSPFVGKVRIDTGLIPPANRLSFSLPDATEITNVAFNALPVFPVVLRVPNAGPTCTPPADVNTPFGVAVTRTVTGSDPEGNPLTFRQISGPGTTTAAGVWRWTPGCPNVGSYQVCVTVSDPNHIDWDTCCFQVTVTQTRPTLSCTDQTIHYGRTLSYFLAGSDDNCPQPLKYFKLSGPGTLNATTGEFRYTPLCADKGVKFVEAGVTDGKDSAFCTFRVTVTNAKPVINCPPNFSTGIGDTVKFQIVASDPDGDPLTFTLLNFQKLSGPTGGGPNFAPSLSPTGFFFWPTTTANDDDFGIWRVSLRVDEPCDSAFCTFEIEVTPNRPPVCTPPNSVSVHWSEGTGAAQFGLFDPDGDSVSITQISGPGSMNASGLWSWSFGCADVGVYQICAVVADSAFPGGDTCCFTFTVLQSAPALTCRNDSVHTGSGPLTIQFTAPDDGCPGNPVRFRKVSGPGTIDSVTGRYVFSPAAGKFSCGEIGVYPVQILATDGVLSKTCNFTVRVYNNPPVFRSCPLDTLQHTNDRLFTFDTDLVDPDGDALVTVFVHAFNKLSGPAGGPNNPPAVNLAGRVTWQTDSSNTRDLGLWRMILEARDTCAVKRCTLFIRVFPNRPPTCLTTDTRGHVGDTAYGGVLGIDPDGDPMTFTKISGPGSIVVAEGAARWTWVPRCDERGEYDVCVVVGDAKFPQADTCCFHVTIFENPPKIHCQDRTVHYGNTLVYDIPFTDDNCPRAATWSLVSGPGSIDPVTGRYTLPTACGDVGTVSVKVALDDSIRADTCSFNVTITNTPPFVNCPPDQEGLKVGVTVNLTIPFGDVDGDPVTISLVSFQKLGGANTNPPNQPPTLSPSGQFQWVTDFNNLNDVATWEVKIRVREPCDSAFCTFRIEILPNDPPVCSGPGDTLVVCNATINRSFTASDTEGDPVTFTLISGPGTVGAASGIWSWKPPCDSGGLYRVCVTVSDFLHPHADTCCFLLSVCAAAERGDVNGDLVANAEDIIIIVNFIFKSGLMPFGPYTADMNCDGVPDARDIIYLVNYVFKSGPRPCDACTSPLFPGLGP